MNSARRSAEFMLTISSVRIIAVYWLYLWLFGNERGEKFNGSCEAPSAPLIEFLRKKFHVPFHLLQ